MIRPKQPKRCGIVQIALLAEIHHGLSAFDLLIFDTPKLPPLRLPERRTGPVDLDVPAYRCIQRVARRLVA